MATHLRGKLMCTAFEILNRRVLCYQLTLKTDVFNRCMMGHVSGLLIYSRVKPNRFDSFWTTFTTPLLAETMMPVLEMFSDYV